MRRASTAERSGGGGGEGARGLESERGRVGEREERAGREPEEMEEGYSSSGSMGEASDSKPCCCRSTAGEKARRGELFQADVLSLPQRSSVLYNLLYLSGSPTLMFTQCASDLLLPLQESAQVSRTTDSTESLNKRKMSTGGDSPLSLLLSPSAKHRQAQLFMKPIDQGS